MRQWLCKNLYRTRAVFDFLSTTAIFITSTYVYWKIYFNIDLIFVLAVLFVAVGSTVARVFVFDDGRPEQRDQAMTASAPAPAPQGRRPLRVLDAQGAATGERVRRDHHEGITGPVHTFVKTDKHAHFKWGVRHHVGHEFAG